MGIIRVGKKKTKQQNDSRHSFMVDAPVSQLPQSTPFLPLFLSFFPMTPAKSTTRAFGIKWKTRSSPAVFRRLGAGVKEGEAHAVKLAHVPSVSVATTIFQGVEGHVTYRRQFGHDNRHRRQKIDKKQSQIVMSVVRADEEETDGDGEQELLGRGILVLVVDLLPHVEVVVGAGVELERDAAHVVEHQVAAEHVRGVDECPGGFLGDGGDDVVEDFEEEDEDDVDQPGA